MARHKNINWNLEEGTNSVHSTTATNALLMDIRDELQELNRILHCQNFLGIPNKLEQIRRNTAKPKRRRPAK